MNQILIEHYIPVKNVLSIDSMAYSFRMTFHDIFISDSHGTANLLSITKFQFGIKVPLKG